MCTICSAFRPYAPTCDYEDLTGASGMGAVGAGVERMQDLPVFTNAQIANVLTDEFWNFFGGQSRRALDLNDDGGLTFDVSGLTAEGQLLARAAIDIWSDAIGIPIIELQGITEASVSSGSDAANSRFSASEIQVGDRIVGNWDDGSLLSDIDVYAVQLTAGQLYSVNLTGLSITGSEITVRDSAGDFVARAEADDEGDGLAGLIFTAQEDGIFYLDARNSSGTYSLAISEGLDITDRPDITFDDSREGATGGGSQEFAYINIEEEWLSDFGTSLDSFSFGTYLHEVGHALGLGHSGFYNFSEEDPILYAEDSHYLNDSWQSSVMSYFSQTDNTSINASYAQFVTPMIADLLAIEELYGPLTIREGDTVYGANSNVEGYLGTLFGILFDGEEDPDLYAGGPIALTVADTGGTDTIDLSTVEVDQRVDLDPGAISNVGGLIGNLVIAESTVIERFEGGTDEDKVFGNAADNVIDGNAGNDILRGGTGDDVVRGGAGDDAVYGGSGDDRATGGSGNDTVIGSSGNDDLFGNGGRDRLDGNTGNDDLDGGAQADELRGHDGVDRLWGGDGGDYLSGGGGNDRLFGGDARDFVYGGQGDDRVAGDAGSDRLYGQSGDDYLIGGADTDWLYGGTGADTFLFGETFDRDLVRDFELGVDTLFINDNLWSGDRTAQDVLNDFATSVDGDVVFDFGDGDVLVVENVASVNSLADDLVIV